MTVAVGMLVLGFLIVIHELGHLFAAKAMKMSVPAFSVGLGPVLWSKKWRGTEYRLSAIPLGGYVMLDPQDPSFQASTAWQRILFFFAGPLANVLLTAVLFASIGRPELLVDSTREMLNVLGGLFSGAIPVSKLSGPVGIVKLAGASASAGVTALCGFAAFLSLNLAILNLLPLPVLDGGQIIIAALEGLIRRPLHVRVRLALAAVTWLLLLSLFAYVTVGDISRIWNSVA
ncbi:MAG: site-2 protease family protein [Planctomycetota bacterium]